MLRSDGVVVQHRLPAGIGDHASERGAGAGGFHSSWVVMNDAVWLPEDQRTVEGFAENWKAISDFSNLKAPQSGSEQSGNILTAMQKVTGTGPSSARS